ncbi:hypothetical protein KHC23_23050 [Ancylobacter dichloromethanicus]|uniref:hypothetical protein n=1 Tax=Ancylobacter dichloromethanicus TaxID=518825 RepID=UPI001BCF020B|nr:hypothetical protein [Ancylobacter dichloromethanicus]MBS7556513.1 hypothetical protein [Ancylobacter dichloromethanicus]
MFLYRFGGQNVSSNVAVNGIRRAPTSSVTEIQVTFRSEGPPFADRMLFSWGGRYDLRLETSGRLWRIGSRLDGTFLIEPDGRRIDVYCSRLPPPQEAMDILSRRVLPRVVTFSGRLAIHAAAVSKNGAALLLLGASGAGKSTTAAYLGSGPVNSV